MFGVPADVELVRAVEPHPALAEQVGEHAVGDRRPHLALDVVADDRQLRPFELLPPLGGRGDERRDAVHHPAPGLQHLLGVPAGRLLGADRQVGDDHVRPRVAQHLRHVGRVARGFGDDLLEVLAEAVERRPALDADAEAGDVGELVRVVRRGEDRLAEIFADLVGADVERGRELDVADVVPAEIDVHQPGDGFGFGGVAVELDALDEGRRAVPHADDRHSDLVPTHRVLTPYLGRRQRGDGPRGRLKERRRGADLAPTALFLHAFLRRASAQSDAKRVPDERPEPSGIGQQNVRFCEHQLWARQFRRFSRVR
jgi:hypothetical protein